MRRRCGHWFRSCSGSCLLAAQTAATHCLPLRVATCSNHPPRGHGGHRNRRKSLRRADRPRRHYSGTLWSTDRSDPSSPIRVVLAIAVCGWAEVRFALHLRAHAQEFVVPLTRGGSSSGTVRRFGRPILCEADTLLARLFDPQLGYSPRIRPFPSHVEMSRLFSTPGRFQRLRLATQSGWRNWQDGSTLPSSIM